MRMTLSPLSLPGVIEIRPHVAQDTRGSFIKTFQASDFEAAGLRADFRETYYSISEPNVIRGMHFQLPPHALAKLVYCTSGEVLDSVLDLRTGPTYGHFESLILSSIKRNMLYIPPGCAHGFRTFDAPATLIYHVTSEYHTLSDTGILWNSFGFDWGITNPIVSERDTSFQDFHHFSSPF